MSKAAAMIRIILRADVVPDVNRHGGARPVDHAQDPQAIWQRALSILHLRHLHLRVGRGRRQRDTRTGHEDKRKAFHLNLLFWIERLNQDRVGCDKLSYLFRLSSSLPEISLPASGCDL